jgi:tetratricopeptide (TPR) repeat protein
LYLAAEEGHLPIVKLLLERGANVNAKWGKDNWTPLRIAEYKGNNQIAELLRQYGASDVTLKAQAIHQRGYDYYKQKDYNNAIASYSEAIQLDPNNSQLYFNRGIAFRELRQYQEALQDFRKAVELDPTDTGAYDNLGWIHAQMGQFDKSIDYYTKTIEIKPQDGGAYYNRGGSYYRKGDLDSALKDAKQACTLGYTQGCTIFAKKKFGI